MPKAISVTESARVAAARKRAFDETVGFPAELLGRKRGLLPGVAKVDGHAGPWSAIGQQRFMTLTDGSSATEELVSIVAGESFAYRISLSTGPFARLLDHGRGEWRLTNLDENETRIDWTYTFHPKSAAARPFVWFIATALWPGYMRVALQRLKASIEKTA